MNLAIIAFAAATLLPLSALAQDVPGAHFIENWDLDGDGSVTLAEAQERRGDVFYTFDANEDKLLDTEEYSLFDEARANDMAGIGQGHGMKRGQEGMTLVFNDVDADGKVSQEEFIARTTDWIELMDRDGGGGITLQDFGPAKN